MLQRVWRKGYPPSLLVGMWIDTTIMENSIEVPQKTKQRTTVWSSNPTPGHVSGQNIHSKNTCAPIVITGLFIIARTWKQPKCPLTDERINNIQWNTTQPGIWFKNRNNTSASLQLLAPSLPSWKSYSRYIFLTLSCLGRRPALDYWL